MPEESIEKITKPNSNLAATFAVQLQYLMKITLYVWTWYDGKENGNV